MMQTRPVWAEISRSRLLNNWNLLREAAGKSAEILAVVKANAYGHGVAACVPVLSSAGAQWFGVTCTEEAVALRRICPDARILVMSGLWDGEAEKILEHHLTPQVWEPLHFDLLESSARKRGFGPLSVPVHLEIDTGMSRQGVRSLQTLQALLARLGAGSPIQIEGVMTHFSASEVLDPDATREQIVCFSAAIDLVREHGFQPSWIHAGNSATLFVAQHMQALEAISRRHSAKLMLRPGLALYGYLPRFVPPLPAASPSAGLQPVLAWRTRIVSLRTIEAGESAGYNMTFRATRQTRLALIPVGYADGLNRLLSNRGHALVLGQRVPIAGRVSMDQTILDVTGVSGVEIGDDVALIGEQCDERITAHDLADSVGTIPYEVTCAISARVPRVIVD